MSDAKDGATGFYEAIPKGLKENLRYRVNLRKRCETDLDARAAVIEACRRDPLVFFTLFGWLFEPRPGRDSTGKELPKIIPFVPWEHQVDPIRTIVQHLGFKDIGAEKSRGEGMSWIAVWICLWKFVFEEMTTIGMVSKDENAVDNPDDPDSLLWKFGFGLERLPAWLRPNFERNLSKHTFKNLDNGSTVTGYAATGDVASGGRKTFFVLDELAKFRRGPDAEAMASTQYVTNSRFFISTPKGSDGEYYRLMHEPSNMEKIILDWKDNPSRNRGVYKLVKGTPVAIDPLNPLPAHYNPPTQEVLDMFSRLRLKGFKLEGVVRSPWYDNECDRPSATPQNVAQELDRDYGGSMFRIFGHDFHESAQEKIRDPMEGHLVFNRETLDAVFDRAPGGPAKLWVPLDMRGRPPLRPYVCGADIGSGLGGSYTSNSVFQVIDMITMEQVMEISSNAIEPGDFADMCIAAAKWFYDAYLAWEANGPGAGFGKRVLSRRYPNIYMRPVLHSKGTKKTKEAGWWTDERSKELMFTELYQMIRNRDVTIHGKELLTEFGQYVRINGKIEHNLVAQATDDAKGKAHGDRVIAFGVAIMAAKDRPLHSKSLDDHLMSDPPPNSFGARMLEHERELERKKDLWDSRDNFDLGRGSSDAFDLGKYLPD